MTKKDKDILDKLQYDLSRIVRASRVFPTVLQHALVKAVKKRDRR